MCVAASIVSSRTKWSGDMSKQLAQGCYPVELWQVRDANPGPLGPKYGYG